MSFDWSAALSDLAASRGWSMRQVALELRVSPQFLHKVVHGVRSMPISMRVEVAKLLGLPKSHELLLELLPPDVAEAWRTWEANEKLS